jgi:hypothetical protein
MGTKLTQGLVAATALLVWQLCVAAPEKKELVAPLPAYAPRASAASVVCSPSSSVTLEAKNEGALGNPLSTAAVIARLTGPSDAPKPDMRLRFGAAVLKVALGFYADARSNITWGPDLEYTVQSDAPEDYLAIMKPLYPAMGIQTLAVNRVTGTAIVTLAIASLPQGAHPHVDSTFYVCQPER